ncbi:MAG: DUF1638 domain-containing protein [bacterium]
MKQQESLSELTRLIEERSKKIAVIACEVLCREICYAALLTRNIIHPVFKPKGLHDNPERMRVELQEEIDRISSFSSVKYQAIVLIYGLCSNGTVGVTARDIPLVIPKAHDCITLFLGSKERYAREFSKNPGTYYFTTGWVERGGESVDRSPASGYGLGKTYEEYVEKYGEENAKYLFELERAWLIRYNQAVYIDMGLSIPFSYEEEVKQEAEKRGWTYRKINGSMKLISDAIDGYWNPNDFLIVPPGYSIQPSYDTNILKVALPNE